MKRIVLILVSLFCFLTNSVLFSQTYISGFISANTTWNIAGSPYIVTGNALLSQGYTLTIEPGVIVKFSQNKALQIDGKLIAIGTPQNRITFTSDQLVPTPGYWAKIHFSDYCTDAVADVNGNYLSGTIMKYCDVLYGGGLGYGLIHIVNSSPFFSNCAFKLSSDNGIYCYGGTCIIDSCIINYCSGYGFKGENIITSSCGLKITNDSIMNNTSGGVYMYSVTGFASSISNGYFYGNTGVGAINIASCSVAFSIVNNTFFGNSYNTGNGMLYLTGNNSLISNNYFKNNTANSSKGMIYLSASNSKILNNTFTDNTSLHEGSLIKLWGSNDSIKCNIFNSNTISGSNGIIHFFSSNSTISNNLFENNTNNDQYGVVVTYIEGTTGTHTTKFVNNIVKNNYCPNGSCCKCYFNYYDGPTLIISNNDFENNNVKYTTYMSANSFTLPNYIQFNNNNLNNPAAQYEFYNSIPYGQSDFHLENNYWGTSNTSHIDQVIFDYFDDANYSVVYYTPVLTSPIVVDTTCLNGLPVNNDIFTSNNKITVYPNPFTDYSLVSIDQNCKNAILTIYNITGKSVKEIHNITGNEIQISRDNLPCGIYLLRITENNKLICSEKVIVLD